MSVGFGVPYRRSGRTVDDKSPNGRQCHGDSSSDMPGRADPGSDVIDSNPFQRSSVSLVPVTMPTRPFWL